MLERLRLIFLLTCNRVFVECIENIVGKKFTSIFDDMTLQGQSEKEREKRQDWSLE